MSLVSSSHLIASFSGAFSMFGRNSDEATAIIGDIVDEANVATSSLNDRKSSGLKRTVSTLHSNLAVPAEKTCSHTNPKNACIVEAKQVEMDFATLTSQPFNLCVLAPNGERSHILKFEGYGQTGRFSPYQNGCGHGMWIFEIISIAANKTQKSKTERIFLDGVGSLFFTIDENLQIRLSSQEFLRLPSACECCSNKNSKTPTNTKNIKRKL